MRPASRLELVELRGQGADTRFGPCLLGGEGLLRDPEQGLRLLPVLQRFFEIGLRLFEARAEFRGVQLRQELVCCDGLAFLDGDAQNASTGLEGEVRLRGLDRSGIVEFILPRLPLPVVDKESHADNEDEKNDHDSLFQRSTSPRYD